MGKKGKSKKQGNLSFSQAKKNGIFEPKRDSDNKHTHQQKASARGGAKRLSGQNSRKQG